MPRVALCEEDPGEALVDEHVHVLVQAPTGYAAEESWRDFRRTWWGDPQGQVAAFRDGTSPTRFLRVDHKDVTKSFKFFHDDLFVRKAYLLFAERCRNAREHNQMMGCLILGQPGIGKSLFLLFLLIDYLARQEVVLFTDRSCKMYLFNTDTVCLYDHNGALPETSRFFSLIDAPAETKPISDAVTLDSYPKTFFVASLSPNPKLYKEIIKQYVLTWWMVPWTAEELITLFEKIPEGPESVTHDEKFVREALKVGPCPRDIKKYILSPKVKTHELKSAIENMNPSAIANLLRDDGVLPNMGSHKVILVTRRAGETPALYDDLCVVTLKSDFVYDEMLDWADRLREAQREEWYSLCKGMGALGAGLAGFLFEGFAIRHTSGNFPTTDDHAPFHDFVRMAKDKTTKSKSQLIRFVYKAKDNDNQITVVTSGDKIILRIRPRCVLPVGPGDLLEPPWRHRDRLTYDKIENIRFRLNTSTYYCPHRHNNSLFDAFFFSVEDRKVVLWVLQMTIARKRDGAPSGFNFVGSLRELASQVWEKHEFQIKYVLVFPRVDVSYHVEWSFAAEFADHEGEVYVQFLDVSTFQRKASTIHDILGVAEEEEEATEIGGSDMMDCSSP